MARTRSPQRPDAPPAERLDLPDHAAPKPAKRARIVYDAEAVAAILADVSAGNSLRRACAKHDMDHSTLLRWVREDEPPGLANQYAHAREQQAHALADGIVDMAMDPDAKADPNLLRVRLDAAKWAASKILPRVYGDRIEANINHTGNVQVGWVIDLTAPSQVIEGRAEAVQIEDCTPPKAADE